MKKRIKVMMDCQVLTLQKFGGISRYFSLVFCKIKKTDDFLIELPGIISCNKYFSSNKFCRKEFKANSVGLKIYKFINFFYNILFSLVFMWKCDIYHPTYYNPFLLSILPKKIKVVITVHDMIHELFSSTHNDAIKTIEWKKKCLRRADHIIAVSNNTKRDILKIYPFIEESKISVIYHGISKSICIEKIKGLPARYVLYVGTRNSYKNFKVLVDAMNKLMLEDKNINLVCVGGGEFTQQEIKMFGIGDRYHYYECNDDELNYIYQHAICLVYPSLYEGFGIPILEAFINRCPVVLSNTSCFPEIALNAALYFNPNDIEELVQCLSELINDDQIRNKYIDMGLKRVRAFDWDNTVAQTTEVYRSIVG